MPRKQKKYHYLYKTTNVVNEKYYVGMHSTNDLDDGYIGSGKYLWNSIRKHGRENFKMEILEFFENRKDLVQREKDMVNEDLLKDPMCMNLRLGGKGGFFSKEACRKGAKRMHEIIWNDPEYLKMHSKKSSQIFKRLHKEGKIKPFDWTGKNHSLETKIKMSDAAKLRVGKKNSQFGSCWITKDGINKKIKQSDLNEWLNSGWIKGRK